MAQPTKPTVPPAPLRSQPDTFSARAEASLVFWDAFATYLDDVGIFTEEQAGIALAAALGGDLPPLTGHALKFLRVNASETAAEFSTIEGFLPLAGGRVTGTVELDPDTLTVLRIKGRASDDISQFSFQGNNGTNVGTFRARPHADYNFAIRDVNNVTSYTFAETGSVAPRVDTVMNRAMSDVRYALSGSSPIKAWVNFNGTGVVAIKASFNVLSVTDLGTGVYRINFATNMADVNYASSMIGLAFSPTIAGQTAIRSVAAKLVGSIDVITGIHTGGAADFADVSYTAIGN